MRWVERKVARRGWDSDDHRWRIIVADNGAFRLIDFEADLGADDYDTRDFSTLDAAKRYAEAQS